MFICVHLWLFVCVHPWPDVAAAAFYISGHGFGHASRQIEIINTLAALRPDISIVVRTSVARWLLERTIDSPFVLDDRPCDTGVVQIDSLHLDAAESIARAGDFHRTLDARADADAGILRRHDVAIVIADAPPLGCAAAARAGVPSFVVSNFTWDWIYAEYAEHLDLAPGLIPTIQAAYRTASAAWRLPMHGGFDTFDHVADIPFVARHARHDRNETRTRLDLPLDRRLALPSFGAYGVQGLDLDKIDARDTWDAVRDIHEQRLYDRGLRYEDLVGAVDVVLTKPGYGILSECIASDTAVVYTPRGRFAEYPVLVREMPKYLRCAALDNDALLAGRWHAALEAALAAPPPPERPRTDGAGIVAGMIAARVPSA